MRNIGLMGVRGSETYRRGMEVIVRSNRGLESGQVLCEATEESTQQLEHAATGQILRLLSEIDAKEVAQLDQSRQQKIETCQKHIDDLKLEMKLVEVEPLFGGERLVVYYLAEDRVDFRELSKNWPSGISNAD